MIAGLALVMLTVAAPSGPQAPPPAGLEQTLQSGLGALFPGGHSTPFTTTAPTPPTLFWQNWSSGSSTQTTTAPHPFRASTPAAAGVDARNGCGAENRMRDNPARFYSSGMRVVNGKNVRDIDVG